MNIAGVTVGCDLVIFPKREVVGSDPVKDWLAVRGYDPVYGARPLKRVIQTQIVNKLAKQLIKREESTERVEFEATVSGNGDHLEFAEVFNDANAWADE